MLIERGELLELLGLRPETGAGSVQRYALAGTARRAVFAWGADGTLSVEVSEMIDTEDDQALLTLTGAFVPEDDAFLVEADDRSGETSDRTDPRAAAALWRRLVRFMEPTE